MGEGAYYFIGLRKMLNVRIMPAIYYEIMI